MTLWIFLPKTNWTTMKLHGQNTSRKKWFNASKNPMAVNDIIHWKNQLNGRSKTTRTYKCHPQIPYDAEEFSLISIARNVVTEMPSNKDLQKPKGNIFYPEEFLIWKTNCGQGNTTYTISQYQLYVTQASILEWAFQPPVMKVPTIGCCPF